LALAVFREANMSDSATPCGDSTRPGGVNRRLLRRATAVVGALVMLTLLWPAGVCFRWAWGEYRVAGSMASAPGVVIGNVDRPGQRGRIFHHAVVRFTAPDGAAITFTDPEGMTRGSHQPGDTVAVAFDPAIPSRGMIDSFGNRWVSVLLWGGVGAACLLVAFFIAVHTIPGNLR
jgi:hypothetical protein